MREIPEDSGATVAWGCVAVGVWLVIGGLVLLILWLT